MNKLIIALSVACASAYVFAADSNATPTPYENLKLNEPTPWFSAKVENGEVLLSDTLTPSGVQLQVDGNMLVVETEADPENMTAVTLTAAAAVQDITTVTFTMLASTVPAENLTDMSDKGKIAFAISGEDSDRAFKAWLGGANWVTLSGATVPADDVSYTLDVLFDSRTGVNKVCFKVGGTVLKKTSEETDDGWYGYGNAPVAKELAVDLVGSGKIASITGSQISIRAEVIPVPDLGSLEVPEKIAQKYSDMTADAPISIGGSEKINVGTAFALGLIKVENDQVVEQNADFTVKADAMAEGGDIPVKFANYNGIGADGAVIKYVLFGSVDGTSFSAIDGANFSSVNDIKIPASAVSAPLNMRYFKVQTQVEVNDPNKVD